MVKIINVLGTEYRVILDIDPKEDDSLEGLYGLCDPQEKTIKVIDVGKMTDWERSSREAQQRQHRENLRHEVLHAFFHESGLWGSTHNVKSWALDEEMVDWFAIQYPKIKRVYKILGCED